MTTGIKLSNDKQLKDLQTSNEHTNDTLFMYEGYLRNCNAKNPGKERLKIEMNC